MNTDIYQHSFLAGILDLWLQTNGSDLLEIIRRSMSNFIHAAALTAKQHLT